MTTFHIFENGSPDNAFLKQQLLVFGDIVQWLQGRGVTVERFDISADPAILANNPTIQSLIDNSGNMALPVILMNGTVKLVGRYPSRSEMSAWAGLQHPLFTFEDKGGTCSGPQCCQ